MSVSASTIPSTPWFGSGSISFSELRNNFKGSTSGSINASELIRYTSTSLTNPVVPDCTENSNVASSRSNWKTSQFRNTIKYYYTTQSGTDSNFNINQSWNGNVGKNIVKNAYINGTCTSSSVSSPAATFSATACNLTIRISGSILAAGGSGGSAGGGNGQNGGTALSINASGSNNLVVNTGGSARVYGGGGGGGGSGKGGKGGNGSYTTYYSYYISIGGGSCSGCGPVYYQRCQRACQNVGGEWANNCYKHTSQGGQNCGGNPSDYWSAVCYSDDASQVANTTACRKTVVGSNTYYTIGGAGGNAVSGGNGQQVRTSGQGYNPGQSGGAFAGNGGNSGRGGDGGDWGQRGQDGGDGVRGTDGNASTAPNFGQSNGPTRGGRGGAAGAALTGSGYSKSGTSSAYRGSN